MFFEWEPEPQSLLSVDIKLGEACTPYTTTTVHTVCFDARTFY